MKVQQWDQFADRLQDSLDASGDGMPLDFVRQQIEDGKAQWLPFETVAIVTQILKRLTGDICLIWLVAGTMAELPKYEDAIVAWAIEARCAELRYAGRRGWLKMLPHWEEIATVGRRRL